MKKPPGGKEDPGASKYCWPVLVICPDCLVLKPVFGGLMRSFRLRFGGRTAGSDGEFLWPLFRRAQGRRSKPDALETRRGFGLRCLMMLEVVTLGR
jgi:hypothetical protein